MNFFRKKKLMDDSSTEIEANAEHGNDTNALKLCYTKLTNLNKKDLNFFLNLEDILIVKKHNRFS